MSEMYLVCNGCGEIFHAMNYVAASEHGVVNPSTKSWCGDNGFILSDTREV